MPYADHLGLSSKIEGEVERTRLRKVLESLERPEGMGLICRTVGEGRKSLYFKNDLNILLDYWEKIDEITLFDYLNFDKILGITVKMMIIRRWLTLDEATGREMFKKLVDEVRGTFKGVEYNG